LAWKNPRWRAALLVAAVSDAIGFGLGLLPPIQWLVDGVTAVVLLMVLGFSWPLMAALVVEAVPALEMFPIWTLVVIVMAGTSRVRDGSDQAD
jgi:hypothetical protein